MRYQATDWSCGPASVVNACQALGIRAAESRIRRLAESDSDGTDEVHLIQAVRALGLKATPWGGTGASAAWAFVRSNVADGRPCLLCIDQWSHWVCVVGSVGTRVIVADSVRTTRNLAENGVHAVSRPALIRRWRRRNSQEHFYAIAVSR